MSRAKAAWLPPLGVMMGFAVAAAIVALGGCSLRDTVDEVFPQEEPKYKSSRSIPPLEVPPDLSQGATNDALEVPDAPKAADGTATYSAYQTGAQAPAPVQREAGLAVLPANSKARIERGGDERWLVVDASAEQVWPKLRGFWLEQGFLLNVDEPGIGIMETDWAEKREPFRRGILDDVVGKLQKTLYGSGTRDKFRTRIERGAGPNQTEIYVAHYGAQLIAAPRTREGDDPRTWQPSPPDPELEVEMLSRMLVTVFGTTDDLAQAQTLVANTASRQPKAELVRDPDGASALVLGEDFTRAWRRTGLALDRIGFTVQDRDRASGVYYVRYSDPDRDKSKPGFWSWLKFWGDDDPQGADDYQINLAQDGEGIAATTRVVVLDAEAQRETSGTADRILTLLAEQLVN